MVQTIICHTLSRHRYQVGYCFLITLQLAESCESCVYLQAALVASLYQDPCLPQTIALCCRRIAMGFGRDVAFGSTKPSSQAPLRLGGNHTCLGLLQ